MDRYAGLQPGVPLQAALGRNELALGEQMLQSGDHTESIAGHPPPGNVVHRQRCAKAGLQCLLQKHRYLVQVIQVMDQPEGILLPQLGKDLQTHPLEEGEVCGGERRQLPVSHLLEKAGKGLMGSTPVQSARQILDTYQMHRA